MTVGSLNADDKIIQFLVDETTKHRGFIELEMQYLIEALAFIFAVASGLTVFMGVGSLKEFKEKMRRHYEKEINKYWKKQEPKFERLVEEKYSDEVHKKLGALIGGDDKINIVAESALLEQSVRKQPVLFITQDNPQTEIKEIFQLYKNDHYSVEMIQVSEITKNDVLVVNILNKYKVLVYEVNNDEAVKSGKPELYEQIAAFCNDNNAEHKVQGIFFYRRNDIANREVVNGTRTSVANTKITLWDRIRSLLVLVYTVNQNSGIKI